MFFDWKQHLDWHPSKKGLAALCEDNVLVWLQPEASAQDTKNAEWVGARSDESVAGALQRDGHSQNPAWQKG